MRSSYSSAMIATSRIVVFSSSESDRKSTRLNSSHLVISYAVFCLKKKKETLTSSEAINSVKIHAANLSRLQTGFEMGVCGDYSVTVATSITDRTDLIRSRALA